MTKFSYLWTQASCWKVDDSFIHSTSIFGTSKLLYFRSNELIDPFNSGCFIYLINVFQRQFYLHLVLQWVTSSYWNELMNFKTKKIDNYSLNFWIWFQRHSELISEGFYHKKLQSPYISMGCAFIVHVHRFTWFCIQFCS